MAADVSISKHVSVRPLAAGDVPDADLTLAIEGTLGISTLADAWDATLQPLRKTRPKLLAIDAAHLDYCDGAGLGLFAVSNRSGCA